MASLRSIFQRRFDHLHERSLKLLGSVRTEDLFRKPASGSSSIETYSCGELLIRSAAAVEQMAGGVTRRLWDDPFEWTLPEELADPAKILEYLEEVRAARVQAFEFFASDQDLFKFIPAPDELKPLAEVLLETIDRATHLHGRAAGVAQQFVTIRPTLT